MPATLKIDQAGLLPPGVPGVSRDDGLDTGALVTLTNTGGGTTLGVNLLWVPPEDVTALPTLTQTGPATFTFSPTPLVWGRYRIEMITDLGLPTESRTIHTFGIPLPVSGLVIPAANELADPSATRQNDTDAFLLEASESNAPFLPFIGKQPFGWWKSIRDLFVFVESLVASPPTKRVYLWNYTGVVAVAPSQLGTFDAMLVTNPALADPGPFDGERLAVEPGTIANIRLQLRVPFALGDMIDVEVYRVRAGVVDSLGVASLFAVAPNNFETSSTAPTVSGVLAGDQLFVSIAFAGVPTAAGAADLSVAVEMA